MALRWGKAMHGCVRWGICGLVALCMFSTAFYPATARADEEDSSEGYVLQASMPATVELDRIGFFKLPIDCDPSVIEVGVPCGMDDMCGLDPCLCGAVDAYGACACNGLEETRPTYEISFSQDGILGTLTFFGTTYLIPLAGGTVDMNVTASLPHYASSSVQTTLTVNPFTFWDVLRLIGMLVVCVLILALIVLIVCLIVHAVRKRSASSKNRETGAGRAEG